MSGSERLIALASTDGKTVRQHFGRADRFHIVAMGEAGYRFVETRSVPPACHDFEHAEHAFDAIWQVLADCKAVVVGRIGPPAAAYLIGKGMRVFETMGMIDEILKQMITERLLEDG